MFDRKKETDVVIVGAGPVGLLTALLLNQRGMRVEIYDRDWRTSAHSYALALHPRTLELLDEAGVASDLIPYGRQVQKIHYYNGGEVRAGLDLSKLDCRFPFLLVLPQSHLETTLQDRVKARKIKVHWNHRVQGITDGEDNVVADVAALRKESMGYPIAHTEWVVGKLFEMSAKFLVGADGYNSRARDAIEVDCVPQGDPMSLAVFEYSAADGADDEVRIVFADDSSNVYWPLNGNLRRWSFQIQERTSERPDLDRLVGFIDDRVGWSVPTPQELRWGSEVTFEPRLASRFVGNRVWLAGDAAHLTGPFGVQSMNAGLFEAREVARRIGQILEAGESKDELMAEYERESIRHWRRLLAIDATITARPDADDWVRQNATRFLPTLPATGDDIDPLLGQLGLELKTT